MTQTIKRTETLPIYNGSYFMIEVTIECPENIEDVKEIGLVRNESVDIIPVNTLHAARGMEITLASLPLTHPHIRKYSPVYYDTHDSNGYMVAILPLGLGYAGINPAPEFTDSYARYRSVLPILESDLSPAMVESLDLFFEERISVRDLIARHPLIFSRVNLLPFLINKYGKH